MDFVKKAAKKYNLTTAAAAKLRSTVSLAGATTEVQVEAVLAGIQKGELNVATANKSLSLAGEYPQRIDECPVCFARMIPVSLANNREANFCPVHNVVMPTGK